MQLLDTLAPNNHKTLDQRGAPARYTESSGALCTHTMRKSRTVVVGCIDVSPNSTVYEPKGVRTDDSFEKHGPEARRSISPHFEGHPPRDSEMLNVSKKDTVSVQTGDSSILGKSKDASSVRPDANTLFFDTGGKESVLLNIVFWEFDRANRTTQTLAPVSKKMDKGIDTIIQPVRKLPDTTRFLWYLWMQT